jgi:ribonuclease D
MRSLGVRVILLSDEKPLRDGEDLVHKQGYLGETAPHGVLIAPGKRVLVDRPAQLQQAADVLRQAKIIAIDAEFTQVRTRARAAGTSNVPRLSLLQLAIEQTCFVIDVLRLQDLSPLEEVIGNPDVIVLLHGAGGDMRVMAERGLYVVHFFDLEATCRSIFGQHESSLAAMTQRAFGMRLDKSLQRTDWTHRPLTPAMIAYAARKSRLRSIHG